MVKYSKSWQIWSAFFPSLVFYFLSLFSFKIANFCKRGVSIWQREYAVWKIESFIINLRKFCFHYRGCYHFSFLNHKSADLFMFIYRLLKSVEIFKTFDPVCIIVKIHPFWYFLNPFVFFVCRVIFEKFKIFLWIYC